MNLSLSRGDRLMLAFRRRHPWRFAALMFFTCLGGMTFVTDFVVSVKNPNFKYASAFAMTAPALCHALFWSRRESDSLQEAKLNS